ncbi:MAG: hypothetical protein AB1797_03200 [bacterium]
MRRIDTDKNFVTVQHMMLDARCSIFDAGKGSRIQDRASSIEFVP